MTNQLANWGEALQRVEARDERGLADALTMIGAQTDRSPANSMTTGLVLTLCRARWKLELAEQLARKRLAEDRQAGVPILNAVLTLQGRADEAEALLSTTTPPAPTTGPYTQEAIKRMLAHPDRRLTAEERMKIVEELTGKKGRKPDLQ